jgi:hypothetical protein
VVTRNRAHAQLVIRHIGKAKTLAEDVEAAARRDCLAWLEETVAEDKSVAPWKPANIALALRDPDFKPDADAVKWLRGRARRPARLRGWHARWALDRLEGR